MPYQDHGYRGPSNRERANSERLGSGESLADKLYTHPTSRNDYVPPVVHPTSITPAPYLGAAESRFERSQKSLADMMYDHKTSQNDYDPQNPSDSRTQTRNRGHINAQGQNAASVATQGQDLGRGSGIFESVKASLLDQNLSHSGYNRSSVSPTSLLGNATPGKSSTLGGAEIKQTKDSNQSRSRSRKASTSAILDELRTVTHDGYMRSSVGPTNLDFDNAHRLAQATNEILGEEVGAVPFDEWTHADAKDAILALRQNLSNLLAKRSLFIEEKIAEHKKDLADARVRGRSAKIDTFKSNVSTPFDSSINNAIEQILFLTARQTGPTDEILRNDEWRARDIIFHLNEIRQEGKDPAPVGIAGVAMPGEKGRISITKVSDQKKLLKELEEIWGRARDRSLLSIRKGPERNVIDLIENSEILDMAVGDIILRDKRDYFPLEGEKYFLALTQNAGNSLYDKYYEDGKLPSDIPRVNLDVEINPAHYPSNDLVVKKVDNLTKEMLALPPGTERQRIGRRIFNLRFPIVAGIPSGEEVFSDYTRAKEIAIKIDSIVREDPQSVKEWRSQLKENEIYEKKR